MLISIAMMLMMGMFMGWICKKIHLGAFGIEFTYKRLLEK